MNITFSEDQVRFLEDRLINKINPTYIYLQMARDKDGLMRLGDIENCLEDLDDFVKIVRGLRDETTTT